MLSIQPNFRTPGFCGGHLPRRFSSMMNYLHSKSANEFLCDDVMHVSTVLNGKEVSGIVRFDRGSYRGLTMDEGSQELKQEFMRTALERYNNKIASAKLREKLLREKLHK